MDDDYESARKLLEELRKKYSGETTKENNLKNDEEKLVYNELKEKYSYKSSSSTSSLSPSSSNTTQRKRQVKNKEPTKTKLLKTNSSKNEKEVITVIIDRNITNNYGQDFMEKLQESETFYKVTDQIFSGLITWESSSPSNSLNEAILIMNWNELIQQIHSNNLLSYFRSLQDILPDKKIFLGLFGLNGYFKYWKFQKTGRMTKTDQKRLSEYKESVKISRQNVEVALIELQLTYNCSYRILNTSQDLIELVLQFTKSIIQRPEKLEKREKYKDYDFHMLKDKKDSVHVDKNGNGLQRLWQQQLTTFELARLETAEAIVSQYSTPLVLFDAYKGLPEAEGKKLVEEIFIRRAAGPISSFRKVGPELSNKLFKFLNSVNGDEVL